MKHKKLPQKIGVYSLLCILAVLICAPVSAGERNDSYITEAYRLRMNGKSDQAETLLIQNLKSDSLNALAWFELARTKHHIFLSKPGLSQEEWNDIKGFAEKSARLDPTNEAFAFYNSYCRLLDAFISMMQGQQNVNTKVNETCDAFQSLLKINPDCYPAMLYQVDLFGSLPEEMGGDRHRAELIAGEMKSKTFGAMAKARLLADTADLVAYWQKVEKETGMDPQVMEELGRAFLFKNNDEQGNKYYMDALKADTSKRYLLMNLARYFVMRSQQDQTNRDKYLNTATELVNSYIQSDPDLLPPLKAHAYAILAMIGSISNDQNSMNKNLELANGIDPFCSKASGMPSDILYYPPGKVKILYTSLFFPF